MGTVPARPPGMRRRSPAPRRRRTRGTSPSARAPAPPPAVFGCRFAEAHALYYYYPMLTDMYSLSYAGRARRTAEPLLGARGPRLNR
ncbi:hypothetical protein EVAR_78296_1 [Eumeta japonica]|uniref:Uncharacterized protein n=1 Tax=Eumeta variegata TaxID=151549 RepID=A0A4C1T5Q6_EUMVA|nr:hypothetical protein EVAR_78296_1 [Eumeta japonica]